MIFIVGGKGLTGSALVRHAEQNNIEYKIIQRENKKEFFGKECDILIYANGNALKYKANEDPYFDFIASTSSIAEYVHKIKYKKFVLLSTVDVYNKTSSEDFTSEDVQINPEGQNVYGYHKWLGENYVKKFCKEFLIFRLPGLVGIGLKKNQVYDFINKEKKMLVSSNSNMNFINTRKITESIFLILDKNISNEIFNLASSKNIRIGDIEKIVHVNSEYAENSESNIQTYKINTRKIAKLIPLTSSEEAIREYYESLKK